MENPPSFILIFPSGQGYKLPFLIYKNNYHHQTFIPPWCSCGADGMLSSGFIGHVG
jgi:hypothetical protein